MVIGGSGALKFDGFVDECVDAVMKMLWWKSSHLKKMHIQVISNGYHQIIRISFGERAGAAGATEIPLDRNTLHWIADWPTSRRSFIPNTLTIWHLFRVAEDAAIATKF